MRQPVFDMLGASVEGTTMRLISAAALVLGWGLIVTPLHAAPLRVAVEGDGAYAPFSFFTAEKTLTGFDIEIAEALCKHVAEGCEITPVDFEVMVDGLAQGRFDASIASMGWTQERADKILFGPTYYRSHTVFIGRADKFGDISPDGLKHVRLASAKATIQQKYLTDNYPGSVVLEGKDLNDAYDKLVAGEVDLVLADSIVQMAFLQSDRGADFAYVGEPLKAEVLNSASYITFKKGLEDKAAEFAEYIKRIRLDGTYDRINRKFVPFSIY